MVPIDELMQTCVICLISRTMRHARATPALRRSVSRSHPQEKRSAGQEFGREGPRRGTLDVGIEFAPHSTS